MRLPTTIAAAKGTTLALVRSDAFHLIANTFVGSAFGFVFWFATARLYTPAELGLGAAYIAAVTFLAGFGEMGLGTALIRFAPQMGAERIRFVNTALAAVALSTLVAAILFVAGLQLWSPELESLQHSWFSLVLFLGTVVAFGLAQMMDRLFVAFQATHLLFMRNIVANIIRLAAIVTIGRTLGATGLLLAVGVAALITLGLAAMSLAPRALPGYRLQLSMAWDLLSARVGYTLGNHFALLLWSAPVLVYSLLIVTLLGAEANAHFYISWMVANLLFVVPTAISTAAFAQASSQERSGDGGFWQTLRLTLLGLIPVSLALIVPGRWILRAFGEGYAAEWALFTCLVASVLPYAINLFVIVHHRIRQCTSWVIWLSAAITIICMLLSAILGTRYGLTGVGSGWLIGQIVGTVLSGLSIARSAAAQAALTTAS